jgi:hypothetical protein
MEVFCFLLGRERTRRDMHEERKTQTLSEVATERKTVNTVQIVMKIFE